ncbi:HEAT repeat domain-containing protein [Vibrio vulnificus]|nr:HEAT repeat domain-containing protein [Vibrio vulnificus]
MSENSGLGSKIKGLVKAANCKTSWKKRLSALQEIKSIDCRERQDVVIRLALHDKVYKVKEEAFRIAQSLGFTKNGQPIKLGRKNIGYKPKDFTKIFQRIKREKKMDEFDLSLFREHFEVVAPEMFDVMLYEKGKKFDAWLENSFQSLPKPKAG